MAHRSPFSDSLNHSSGEAQAERLDRRRLLQAVAATGIGTLVFQRALADEVARSGQITADSIAHVEWITGLQLSAEERQTTAAAVQSVIRHCRQLRAIRVDYSDLPALRFDPEMVAPQQHPQEAQMPAWLMPPDEWPLPAGTEPSATNGESPGEQSDSLSFRSIRELAQLLRSGEITSVQLTRHCLDRLQQADELLKCVVTMTQELAIRQAERADQELADGQDRGLLHGIPWGAKDLISVPDYPTTWGAPQFRQQTLDRTATVAARMQQAGAVLVAKLSLGALAMGDRWFGGITRNPWNPEQGSSGSSAGSASAVAAGLVPLALGSETLGSIVSPSRRCGIAGLRPTFGRVSRAGCMPLSWSMDKIGPLARSVDDLGITLNAIHGSDSSDPTAVDRWFQWPVQCDLSQLTIGRIENAEITPQDQLILDVLAGNGAMIRTIELPRQLAEWSVAMMLDVEAATVFHDLLQAGDTEGLNAWPDIFRRSHLVSAVDFLHASRVRFKLMQRLADVFQQVNLYVGGNDLAITNLTGHPTLVLPVMMSENEEHPQPVCGTLTGRLFDEATLLAVGSVIERTTAMQQVRPPVHE